MKHLHFVIGEHVSTGNPTTATCGSKISECCFQVVFPLLLASSHAIPFNQCWGLTVTQISISLESDLWNLDQSS